MSFAYASPVTSDSCVVFDTGVLGILTNPNETPEAAACRDWMEELLPNRVAIIVPDIADYELRREMLQANLLRALRRLDALESRLPFLPLQSSMMRDAAQLWAHARKHGHVTASKDALDGDVILVAQTRALSSDPPYDRIVIATTNVADLAFFTDASEWRQIGVNVP